MPAPRAPHFAGGEQLVIGSGTVERMVSPARCPALATHRIHLAGHSVVRSGAFHITRPSPAQAQVLVVLGGRGRCWCNGQWHTLQVADAFISPAATPHAYVATGKWEFVWCLFAADAFPGLQKPRVASGLNTTLWASIVTGLLEETAFDANSPQSSHWGALLALEGRRLIAAAPADSLDALWAAVRKQLHADWTLTKLCRKAGLSAESLRLRCWREQQMSPMACLAHLRMTYAADMLRYGLKVEYVARAVGYENASSFSAAFHRITGTTPGSLKLPQKPS